MAADPLVLVQHETARPDQEEVIGEEFPQRLPVGGQFGAVETVLDLPDVVHRSTPLGRRNGGSARVGTVAQAVAATAIDGGTSSG